VFVGGVSETVADPFPIVAVTPVGTPGFPAGLTDAEDAEPVLLPVALFATVENEYEVPLVRPVIVQEVAGDITMQVAPPGDAVTVYEVGAPPDEGATTVIVAFPSPAETVGAPGVPGAATFQIAVKVTFAAVMLYVALA
jgi:hypothetical protein